MKKFDRKFGEDFFDTIPSSPGIYRWITADGETIYVGKAKNLRRRISQYRTIGRGKKHRKIRKILDLAVKLEWEVFACELDAAIAEVRLIQAIRPRLNVSSAFPFLYPLIGISEREGCLAFCLTTKPDRFPGFRFHGAYRSRELTGEAFFSLMSILRYVGHPVPKTLLLKEPEPQYSYLFGFRKLPCEWLDYWDGFFRGASVIALQELSLKLLDNAGARAKASEVQEALRTLRKFWKLEARPLNKAIQASGFGVYPVPQQERDPLFLRYRNHQEKEVVS